VACGSLEGLAVDGLDVSQVCLEFLQLLPLRDEGLNLELLGVLSVPEVLLALRDVGLQQADELVEAACVLGFELSLGELGGFLRAGLGCEEVGHHGLVSSAYVDVDHLQQLSSVLGGFVVHDALEVFVLAVELLEVACQLVFEQPEAVGLLDGFRELGLHPGDPASLFLKSFLGIVDDLLQFLLVLGCFVFDDLELGGDGDVHEVRRVVQGLALVGLFAEDALFFLQLEGALSEEREVLGDGLEHEREGFLVVVGELLLLRDVEQAEFDGFFLELCVLAVFHEADRDVLRLVVRCRVEAAGQPSSVSERSRVRRAEAVAEGRGEGRLRERGVLCRGWARLRLPAAGARRGLLLFGLCGCCRGGPRRAGP